MNRHPLLQIDLQSVINSRLPRSKRKFVPRFAMHILEKLIRQDGLNELLRNAYPAEGPAFSDSILRQLGVSLKVKNADLLPADGSRITFVSNHPLGGLDGIAIVKVLGDIYGKDHVKVLVNDLLMYVTPLSDMFVPVNKYGRQGRDTALQINRIYESDNQICVFPAGLVSRLGDNGVIQDLKWHKAFVVKALEYDRIVVPMRFDGLNSMKFYRLARLRKRLGIKVNLEQSMLPGEVFNAKGKEFCISFGTPLTPDDLRRLGSDPVEVAQKVKEMVYAI